VLPFANQSGDTSQEYFSDGLTEELINGLGQVPELRVIGRNSSFYFKGRAGDSRAIGQALGVANLVEGSVRKSGDRVRVAVQLVNAADGSQRWSETYDRELKDIFAVQEEIAKAVADQLRVRLLGDASTVSSKPSNQSVAAYNAYLQAQYHYPQRILGDGYVFVANDAASALPFLDEALRFDPNYAEAYVLKAQALSKIAYSRGVNGKEAFEEAKRASKAALSLKPNLPTARAAMAYINMFADWDLPAAQAQLAAVQEKNPAVLANLATLRGLEDRKQEAIELRRQAISLDPANSVLYSAYGIALHRVGRFDEAEQAYRKALELQPTATGLHFNLVHVAVGRRQPDVALREAELAPPGFPRDWSLAVAYSIGNSRSEADASMQRLIGKYGEDHPANVAGVYSVRGDGEKMFEWMNRAYERHDPFLIGFLAASLYMAPFQSDPRYVTLCNKIGMPVPK
jgi:serine/threonine-protein kinase